MNSQSVAASQIPYEVSIDEWEDREIRLMKDFADEHRKADALPLSRPSFKVWDEVYRVATKPFRVRP